MNDTVASAAPAALSPASLGLPIDNPAAATTATAPTAAAAAASAPVGAAADPFVADAGAAGGAAAGSEGGAANEGGNEAGTEGATRKNADEAFAELDQRALKVHKSLATTGERRKVALDWLDPQRDRVRLALGNVRMRDADVDALIGDYVTTALAAAKGV